MADLNPIIQYRYERSSEAYQEALLLFIEGHYNSTVNRLYYSAFYFVSGFLLHNEIYSKSHSGLKSLFHEHLIKTNRLSREQAEIYNELFEFRHNADYKDLMISSRDEVEPLIERTQYFLNEIKKFISE